MSLAFNTDRQTLEKRVEQHMRARDNAEENIQTEMEALKKSLKVQRDIV